MKKTQSFISFLLCLILLFSVVVSPLTVKVHASAFVWDFFFRSIAGSVLFSASEEASKFSATGLAKLSQVLGNLLSDVSKDYLKSQEALSSATGISQLQLKQSFLDEIFYLVVQGSVVTAVGMEKMGIDVGKMKSELDQVVVEENVTIYLPSEKALERPALITQQQLLSGDFAEALAWNNILLHDIKLSISGLNTNINKLRDDTIYWSQAINTTTAQFGRDVETYISALNSTVSKWGRDQVEILNGLNSTVSSWSRTLNNSITNLGLKFDALVEVFPEISQRLDSIVEKIPAYVEPEVIPKPNIQVEVGSQVLAVTDYQSLGKAFEMKLSWIPQIFNFLRELFEQITYTGEPPKVILNLSSSDPDSPWNRDVTILDMSFYEPYKNYGDKVISGFMWLAFGWTLYKRVPDVLNGAGISQDPALSLDSGYSSIGKHEKKRKNGGKHSD